MHYNQTSLSCTYDVDQFRSDSSAIIYVSDSNYATNNQLGVFIAEIE